ncbi:MAG: hypothetical protein K2X81_13580, partial [Candidatus Obscuribacterales bacterium]|nr:hypothetical protein [Candidatus Obscuribacterales bacterium]
IKIPVTEFLIPNATVQVDLDGPNCAYSSGEIALNVSSDSRKLKLDVSADKKELSPGEKTRIVFKLKDNNGKGTKSQVAVAVVDESVLALSGYDWSDPTTVFYTSTYADTQDLHSRQYIILPTPIKPPAQPRRMFAPAPMARSGAGGGFALGGDFLSSPKMKAKAESFADGDAKDGNASLAASLPPPPLPGGADPNTPIALRTNFSALAYFNPSITTDNNGEASCEIQIPDNLTRYRIMAVAASGDRLFGQGESTVTARLPLMVRPSAPRFLNFGDKCELPVVIQNQTDHEMSVDLGLRADNLKFIHKTGDAAEDKSSAKQSGASVLVPANDRVEVRFPAATDADGNATIDIAAASGEYADAANVVFPVYTPATTHAFAAYGQIDEGGAEQMISVPKDVYDQIGGLDINTSSTALQSLTDAYIYLHDYSFACSEQLSSRVLATTALQDTLTAFGKIDQTELKKIKKQTQDDIDLLCQRQKSDGSFALWKLAESGHWPFLAVQITRALNQAKSKGYNVPDDVVSKAKSYLSRIETQLPKADYDTRTALSIRSYALFVMSLMQNKDPGKAREIIRVA